jgi:hypothetical protein
VRNTYTLIDFGKLLSKAPKGTPDPFIQMLSLTDVTAAHKDFVNIRLNGVDNTADASQQLLPPDQGKSSPQSDAEKKAIMLEKVLSRWPYILMGSLLLFFLGVGFCVWKCCCGRCREKRKRAKAAGGGNGDGSGNGSGHGQGQRTSVIQAALPLSAINYKRESGPYRPLQDPPPSAPPPYSSSANLNDPYYRG